MTDHEQAILQCRRLVSADEHDSIRAHFMLWSRGRVYFENFGDSLPRCKSANGLTPDAEIGDPIRAECGEWDERGIFVPKCPLAMWNTADGERRSPVCKENWNLLGVASDDGMPFWISLKGTSLRPARQFLSMCYARIQMQQADLFQCWKRLSKNEPEVHRK